MKKFFKYFVFVLVFAIPVVSFALDFREGDQPSVKPNEKLTNDVYIGGGSVNSAGSIAGDLVAGGGNIVVSGDVSGDVIALGGTVSILSNVGDDVRAGGGTIIVAGKIGGDALLGGGQVNLGGAGVGGDAAIGGGNVTINAPIAGKLYIGGGNVYINAPIGGDVKIEADKVTLGSAAVISGNLTYRAKAELTQETGATIKGVISFKPKAERRVSPAVFAAVFSALLIWKFFALLACALVVGMIFRRYCREMIALATERPFFEFGKGIMTLILIPIVSIFLFVTLVGIPFGVLGLIAFVALLLFSWITAPIILGSVAYKYFSKKELEVSWKTILLGVVLYSILGMIPFIGWLLKTFLVFLALGSIVTLKLRIVKDWR